MLILNILANWAVVFLLTGLAWSIGNYPGDKTVFITSAGIVAGLIAISLTCIGERLAVFTEGSRKPNDNENNYILPYLYEVCEKAKVQLPNVYISSSSTINARAIGRKTIILNQGLLKNTSPEELCGVLAHEIGHIVYKDTVRLSVMYTLNFVGAWTSYAAVIVIGALTVLGRRVPILGPVFLLVLLIKVFQLVTEKLISVGILAVGRREELRADKYAVSLGYGAGLKSFLSKKKEPKAKNRILSTHPPLFVRLKNLENCSC